VLFAFHHGVGRSAVFSIEMLQQGLLGSATSQTSWRQQFAHKDIHIDYRRNGYVEQHIQN
jgi:hypothetical protein